MGEEKDRALVRDFVEWSWRNHLFLNMDKTRDMVMDFRKERTATQLLSILGGGGGLQVPGRAHGQQTEVEDQHRGCWTFSTRLVL